MTRAVSFLAGVLFALLPSVAGGAAIRVKGEPLVLGEASEAAVAFVVDEPRGTDVLPLRVAVNVGAFGPVVRDGPGRFHALYRLPETRFPQVALVAVWRETGPDAAIDFFRIPLYGVTRVDVTGAPNSEVSARFPQATQGPFPLDRRGRATLTLKVPPGVAATELVFRSPSGATASRRVAIEVPRYNRLTAALVPHAVPADGRSWARLEVLFDDARPVDPGRLRVEAMDAAVSLMRVDGNRFTYRLDPRPRSDSAAVPVTVHLEGETSARAAAALSLALPPPSAVLLSMDAPPLVAGSGSLARLRIRVQADTGLGLARQHLAVECDGARLTGVVDEGQGWYHVAVPAPSSVPAGGALRVRVRLETASKAGPTAELLHPVVAGAAPTLPPPLSDGDAPLSAEVAPHAALGVGAHAFVSSALGQTFAPRLGLDGFASLGSRLRLGVAGSVSQVANEIAGAGLATRSEARSAALSARLAFTPASKGRFAAWAGAGPLVALASFSRAATGEQRSAVGLGGLAFADATLRLGPGELFTEVAWGWAPLRAPGFTLQGGGLELGAGFRLLSTGGSP